MDRGGKRKYIKIRQLEEKLSQKRREPTGCKYIGKYIKQDLVVVSVLVGAQLLVNVSGLQLRYSNVNRIAAESVYMKLTDTHETGIGKLCAAQNAEVEKMVKNLTETKLERMMAVKELPVVEEIPVSRKTMSVPDVHWIKAGGESEGISSEGSETMNADNVIAVDGNLEKIGIDWHTDSPDGGDHMNPRGAAKVTAWIGDYLRRNYDLPDRREDPAYENWNLDAAAFRDRLEAQE